MISSLIPIGGAALVSLAADTLRHLPKPSFLQELLGGPSDPAGSSSKSSSESTTSSTKAPLDLQTAIPALSAKLRTRLAASGINLEEPLTLESDGHGGIRVDGDHPDRMVVEELLAADPELSGEFQTISAAATNEYQQQVASLGGISRDFRLRIDARTATILFE